MSRHFRVKGNSVKETHTANARGLAKEKNSLTEAKNELTVL
jgi:hypothetical protein